MDEFSKACMNGNIVIVNESIMDITPKVHCLKNINQVHCLRGTSKSLLYIFVLNYYSEFYLLITIT
jgi:hypothetical protein